MHVYALKHLDESKSTSVKTATVIFYGDKYKLEGNPLTLHFYGSHVNLAQVDTSIDQHRQTLTHIP